MKSYENKLATANEVSFLGGLWVIAMINVLL